MKRYLFSFGAALLCHSCLLLIPEHLERESEIDDQLLEIQLLNEDPPPKPKSKPPSEPAPPPPPVVKKVKPVLEPPEEIIPEPDVIAEEEEIIEEKKSVPTPPAPPVQVKVIPTISKSRTISVFDASKLDNQKFKPFGNRKPRYPSIARKAGIEGWVKVKVLVNTKGKVIQSKVTDYSGHSSFKQATLDVAKGWRFPIPMVNNKRVQTWYSKKIGFVLKD